MSSIRRDVALCKKYREGICVDKDDVFDLEDLARRGLMKIDLDRVQTCRTAKTTSRGLNLVKRYLDTKDIIIMILLTATPAVIGLEIFNTRVAFVGMSIGTVLMILYIRLKTGTFSPNLD